jgi:hypothetical protein
MEGFGNIGTAMSSPAANRQPEIVELVEMVQHGAQNLALSVGELEKRLSLALRSEPPTQPSADCQIKPGPKTGLGNLLEATLVQLQGTHVRVCCILDRLEL